MSFLVRFNCDVNILSYLGSYDPNIRFKRILNGLKWCARRWLREICPACLAYTRESSQSHRKSPSVVNDIPHGSRWVHKKTKTTTNVVVVAVTVNTITPSAYHRAQPVRRTLRTYIMYRIRYTHKLNEK